MTQISVNSEENSALEHEDKGVDRDEILKIIQQQNGFNTYESIKNMTFTPKIISILEFAGDIVVDEDLQACIEDMMFPSEEEGLGNDVLEKIFSSGKTPEEIELNASLLQMLNQAKFDGNYEELMLGVLDKAGYFGYIVNPRENDFSEAELKRRQDAIHVYFEEKERLCTFKSNRFERCYIIHLIDKRLIQDIDAVKKSLAEGDYDTLEKEFAKAKNAIPRSDNPLPTDAYNLSVLSVQFGKETGFISIKCRYNHTAGHGCDRTLDSNPNNIHPGLRIIMNRFWGFRDNHQRTYKIPQECVLSHAQQIVQWHQEKEGIFFSSKCYFKDGIVYPLKDGCVGVEDFVIDKNARAVYTESQSSSLASVLDAELVIHDKLDKSGKPKRRAIEFSQDKKTKETLVMVQQDNGSWKKLLSFKNGYITSLNLLTTTELPHSAIYSLSKIREFSAPVLKYMKSLNCIACNELEKIDCPMLETTQDRCFLNFKGDIEFNHLKEIGDLCFRGCEGHIRVNNLKSAGEMCFFKCVGGVECAELEDLGAKSFNLCSGDVHLPKVKELEESCFLSCQGNVYMPALKGITVHTFNYHKGDVYAENLERIGHGCFSYGQGNFFLYSLVEIGNDCMCFHAGKIKAPELCQQGRRCFCYTDIFNVTSQLFGKAPVKKAEQPGQSEGERKK